jgi:hypothetical protein
MKDRKNRLPPPAFDPEPAARLRSWRVSLLRQRARYLGTIEARDEKTAEAAAVEQFGLDDDERRRLAVREQP